MKCMKILWDLKERILKGKITNLDEVGKPIGKHPVLDFQYQFKLVLRKDLYWLLIRYE